VLETLQPQLQALAPQQVVSCLSALGQLQHQAARVWLDAAYDAAFTLLRRTSTGSTGSSSSKGGGTRSTPGTSAGDLVCQLVMGCADQDYRLSEPRVHLLLAELAGVTRELAPGVFLRTWVTVGDLGWEVPEEVQAVLQQQLQLAWHTQQPAQQQQQQQQQQVGGVQAQPWTPEDLCQLPATLYHLGVTPLPAWCVEYRRVVTPVVCGAPPSRLAQLLWGVSMLRWRSHSPFVLRVLRLLLRGLHRVDPQGLTWAGTAVATWGLLVGPAWQAAWQRRLSQLSSKLSQAQQADVGWAARHVQLCQQQRRHRVTHRVPRRGLAFRGPCRTSRQRRRLGRQQQQQQRQGRHVVGRQLGLARRSVTQQQL
jgi:hypothetical protein